MNASVRLSRQLELRFIFSWLCLLTSWLPVFAEDPTSDQLTTLMEEMWEYSLTESPQFATSVGDHRFNDRLRSVSLADSERRNRAQQAFMKRLKAIDPEQLSADGRINYDIMRRQLNDDLTEYRFGSHLTPITQRSGFHIYFPELPQDVPLNTVKDHENYLARLRAFGDYAEGHMELMRAGIAAGKVLPAVVLEGWEKSVDAQIVQDSQESLFYKPLQKFPTTVATSEHERLRHEADKAISEVIVPTYRRLHKFMAEEYVPQTRGSIGASALPGGRDFYRHRVRRFTTLNTTPDEVHQIGLAEVKRIRGEMDEIIRRVEFEGDFAAFTKFLREDPKFYANTAEELLKEVALVLKRMDGELPKLFGRLPRMPYGVKEVPAYIAPRTTAAYYQRPNGDGTKAGFYFMNTYNLSSRPKYTVAALSLHEAVPGHHLQIALQQELKDLPNFRRYSGFTAFVEGWALYAERLGLEVGIYEDPYHDFGRLTMEIWRACRLVVDTGIHYFGWTRRQAIDFLHDNSAMSDHNIRAEVDRYISWPGQALAYKTGEMKIRELRHLAEEQLGERFDIRAFHDVVLGSGGIPLDVLEANVKVWLKTQ
jgi:uncharacterized protein (DUF885 family)